MAVTACASAAVVRAEEEGLVSLPIRKWKAIGPLGHARLKERPEVPHPKWPAHNFVYRLYTGASYPMDEVIDLDAVYEGDITRNSKGGELRLGWVEVVAVRENHVLHPPPAQMIEAVGLSYFSTWIAAPSRMTLPVQFPAYSGTARFGSSVAVWVNGGKVRHYKLHSDNPYIFHPRHEQEITLRKGWNHIYSRHISAFWGNRMAMILKVEPELVFDIKISAEPPPEVGRCFDIAGRKVRSPKPEPARVEQKPPEEPVKEPEAKASPEPEVVSPPPEPVKPPAPAREPEAPPAREPSRGVGPLVWVVVVAVAMLAVGIYLIVKDRRGEARDRGRPRPGRRRKRRREE